MSIATPELGIDLSRKMDAADSLATQAFLADMYAEFDREYAAVEAEVGAPHSSNVRVYRERLNHTGFVIREANQALKAGMLPW